MFEVGHLVTLGIAIILIVFFRLLDKSNRSLDKVRKYVDRCKEDITAYIEDKSSIVKDYGIALEVEKKAAAELMRRIQKLTKEDLTKKVQALAQVEDRIQGYDASLTELIQMTSRVQENLNRIRDESAFVEGVAKRLGEMKEKVETAEGEINSVSGELESIGVRFERENTEALERTAETIVADTRSAIQDLEAKLAREEERIVELFSDAVSKAGSRADKVEETALAKLRGQAEERLARLKTTFEEKLKSLQEFVKTNRDEMQELIRLNKEEWQTETSAMDSKKEEWDKQAGELSSLIRQQASEMNASIQEQNEELREEIMRQRSEWEALCNSTGLEITVATEERIGHIKASFEENLESAKEFVKTGWDGIQELIKLNKEEWQTETDAMDAQKKALIADARQLREEWETLCNNTGLEISASAEDKIDRMKASFEENLESTREFIKTSWDEAQELIKRNKEEWQTETDAMDSQKKAYIADARQFREEWNKQAGELASLMKQQTEETNSSICEQDEELRKEINRLREEWKSLCHDTSLEVAAATDDRIEEYRLAQEERLNQLASLTDDSAQLEKELRLAMEEAVNRVNGDFTRLGKEMNETWETASLGFTNNLQALREELLDVERRLSKIKDTASENISGKLKVFEDEFMAELSKRSAEAKQQIETWQDELNSQLESITTDAEARRRKAEIKITDEMKQDFTALSEKLMSDLENMKANAATFEEKATMEMSEANEARRLLFEQLERNLAEAKTTMEDTRRESKTMSKAFERSGALKKELDLHDDKLKDNTERLSRLDTAVAKFESEFSQMKHLEDDINARITRFIAEKRRIEGMESDFNNLLRTAKSVEEKLTQISNSDDTLQAVQLKIRQLDEVIKDAEEKFQRVERKTQTLQETNDGIDRNFQALQENEQFLNRLDGTIGRLKTEVGIIQNSVETLSAENEKTLEAAEKLSTLDESIKWLEDRIAEMNKAREMATRLATELRELDESARAQLKMARSFLKQPSSSRPVASDDGGAPPLRDRDNIIRLRRQGWSIEEIARSMNVSKGEVELTLELAPKDT